MGVVRSKSHPKVEAGRLEDPKQRWQRRFTPPGLIGGDGCRRSPGLPVVVDDAGQVHETGTGRPVEEYLEEIRAEITEGDNA